jgi:hypothetical protein
MSHYRTVVNLAVTAALAIAAPVIAQQPGMMQGTQQQHRQQHNATPILVYASPSCGCCGKWMKHLEANGFLVSKELVSDVTPIKQKFSVPQDLRSCHTAIVDGYVIEGHVPADVIRKMLDDRPAFAGLAVPGMPNGAPGMEGATKDRYDVISFTRTGETKVYAVR